MRNEKELNRQEILDKALEKELKYLKKKIYYRQRRTLLWDDVRIEEEDFKDNETAGLYEYDEETFTHIIKVNTEELDREIARGRKRDRFAEFFGLRLKDIIRHELVHAFVKEKYQHITPKIKYMNGDASPIFLSILTFVKGKTNHDCKWAFMETDLYREVKEITEYKELHAKLIKLLIEYRNISDYFLKDETMLKLQSGVTFNFSSSTAGLEKFAELKTDYKIKGNEKLVKTQTRACKFNIGCNVKPEQIVELVKRKLKNDVEFKYAEEKVVYAIVNNKKDLNIIKEGKTIKNLL